MSQYTIIHYTLSFLVLILLTNHSYADLEDELEAIFETALTNGTDPQSWQGQLRGGFSGGRMIAKTKIYNQNLLSFTPPSFSKGCGGIDLYLGSFSFVDSDQLVQLFRSVAQNAVGYGFQVALSGVCEDCATHINTFQKKIQALNEKFSNSCEMAQGIINDIQSARGKKGLTDASLIASQSGYGDIFTTWDTSDGKENRQKAEESNPDAAAKKLDGNLVWRGLKSHDVESWFGAGDNAFLEILMSMSGTIIVTGTNDLSGNRTEKIKHLLGNKVTMEDLIHGGTIGAYHCDTTDEDGCLNPVQDHEIDFEGLVSQVNKMFLGRPDLSIGIVAKLATNDGGELLDDERAFTNSIPASFISNVRNLALKDQKMAALFATKGAEIVAVNLADHAVNQLLRVINLATQQDKQDNAYSTAMRDIVKDSTAKFAQEGLIVAAKYPSYLDMTKYYTNLMTAVTGYQFTPDSVQTSGDTNSNQ